MKKKTVKTKLRKNKNKINKRKNNSFQTREDEKKYPS